MDRKVPHYYWGGCSFTLGAELQHEENRFSKLVSRNFEAKEVNESRGGASNFRILRKFIDASNKQVFKFVFIMWTNFDRFEHWAGREDGGFDPITAFRLFPEEAENKHGTWNHFKQYNGREKVRQALIDYQLNIRTRAHQVAEFLQQALTVQTICRAKRIPYMMTFYQHQQTIKVIKNVLEDLRVENEQAYEWMLEKYNLIDWKTPYWLDSKDFAFLEYTKQNNYDIGPDGHPLEDAHAGLSQLIINQLHHYEASK